MQSQKELEKDPEELHRDIIQKQRFGIYIKKKRTGFCIQVMGVFAALLIIPIQTLFEDDLKHAEIGMITSLQAAIP